MPAAPPTPIATLERDDRDRDIVEVHAGIESYYTERVLTYGTTPPGVDWRCAADQELRFAQLLAVCDFSQAFSLNDLGCGYAALWGYLADHYPGAEVDYMGIDLSGEMIARAKRLWPPSHRLDCVVGHASPRVGDHSVASGIFNVKLDRPIDRWERFVARTLIDLHATSQRGFAVNFMAREASLPPPPEELYCTSAEPWIIFCQRELGASVELRAGYGLREFTLLVRPHSVR